MWPQSGDKEGFSCRIWNFLTAFLEKAAKLLLLEQWLKASKQQ